MARLDPLLTAMVQHRMEALVLEPDRLPHLRRGDERHEVTRTALDRGAIRGLLSEVVPESLPAGAVDLPGTEFDYALGERRFRVTIGPEAEPYRVEIRETGDKGPPAAEPAGSAPARVAAQPLPSIDRVLELLLDAGGSDLHLSAGQEPRVRVDGSLEPLGAFAEPRGEDVERLLAGILPERSREELEARRDADFAYQLGDRARFRVNVFHDRNGLGAVFRQIPFRIPGFDELGLPEPLRRLADLSKGLVLVTGPTGSGKSTTLAAIVDLINEQRGDHIITIEDPIEFVHRSKRCLVNQREIGVHAESFQRALRAALREDPDIVLVGEMRDLETVSIAIETAETGHLVFGTLHTTTAASTVERVVDQFPGDRQGQIRMMLADSLRAVIAQTLLKKIGGGRVAAFEILVVTPAVANLIREGKTFQIASAMQTGRKIGMTTLTESLVRLVESRTVAAEEAYAKAVDKEALVRRLEAADLCPESLAAPRSGER